LKPIIGITVEPQHEPDNPRSHGKLTLNWNYPEVVADAGGVPIMIPPTADMAEIAKLIDGWLIPGGLDIDAKNFGEENHPEVELQDPSRFESEMALYSAIDPQMPVLGICYGCQFLNVARGGALLQHLPDELQHDNHSGGTQESLEVLEESKLSEIFGPVAVGKSYHHQAVGRIGSGLKITAKSPDGLVEGIEAEDRDWMVAVQWHPERCQDDSGNRDLIRRFVSAAAEFAKRKGSR